MSFARHPSDLYLMEKGFCMDNSIFEKIAHDAMIDELQKIASGPIAEQLAALVPTVAGAGLMSIGSHARNPLLIALGLIPGLATAGGAIAGSLSDVNPSDIKDANSASNLSAWIPGMAGYRLGMRRRAMEDKLLGYK
jgi:hypothetical protein